MTTKSGENLLYGDLSYAIRGACFDLYKQFGGSFKESIINKSLVKALESKGLKVKTQEKINIFYDDEKVGVYIPDLIIEDKILIELKVKPFLTKEDDRQFWHYLKCSEYKLGFLINFGSKQLQIKRRVYDKAREKIRVNPLLQNKNPRQSASIKAQVMLLTVLVLSGSILGDSTIVGYLMLLRVRASSDITNSTKAVFAADTGIEWELYKCFKCNPSIFCDSTCTTLDSQKPSMSNGSTISSSVVYDDSGAPQSIKSTGQSSNIFRAFETKF